MIDPVYDPFVHQDLPFSDDDVVAFTPPQVEEGLKSFDKKKVASPDNLPMMFFMRLSLSVSLPLCILFNKSFSEVK